MAALAVGTPEIYPRKIHPGRRGFVSYWSEIAPALVYELPRFRTGNSYRAKRVVTSIRSLENRDSSKDFLRWPIGAFRCFSGGRRYYDRVGRTTHSQNTAQSEKDRAGQHE